MSEGEKDNEVTAAGEAAKKRFPKLRRWARKYWLTLATIAAVTILSLAIYCTGGMSDNVSAYGYFGAFLISLLAATVVFVPIPSVPVVFLLGAMLNPFLVGLMSGVGECLGEMPGYIAGVSGREALDKKDRYPRIKQWMERRGTLVLFLFAAIPNFFFKLIAAAAGALRYPFWKFALVTFIGKTVKGTIIALLGYWALRLLLQWLLR